MPIWIDHSATQHVVDGFQQFVLAACVKQSCAITTSNVQDVLVRIGTIGRVAVDAHSLVGMIVEQGGFLERTELTLIDAHQAEHLVAWGNTTIGDSPIGEIGFGNVDAEVAIALPLSILSGTDGHIKLPTSVLLDQGVPLVDVEVGAFALRMERATLGTGYHNVDVGCIVIVHREIEWGDADRDGDIHIVGIDDGQGIHEGSILRAGRTSR